MSDNTEIEFELVNKKYAPWGLLTEEERPRVVVWLTEVSPIARIPERIIPMDQWDAVRRSMASGIIRVRGASFLEELEAEDEASVLQPVDAVKVASDTQKELASSAEAQKQADPSNSTDIKAFLGRKAPDVVKGVKERDKGGASLSFFQACKKAEGMGKARKKVLKALQKIIERKVSEASTSGPLIDRFSNQTWLDTQYAGMITEEPTEPSR